jgi:hypothetical protein
MSRLSVEGLVYFKKTPNEELYEFSWASNNPILHDYFFIGNTPRVYLASMINEHLPVICRIYTPDKRTMLYDGKIRVRYIYGGKPRLSYLFSIEKDSEPLKKIIAERTEPTISYLIIEEMMDMEVGHRNANARSESNAKNEPMGDSIKTAEINGNTISARERVFSAVQNIANQERRPL